MKQIVNNRKLWQIPFALLIFVAFAQPTLADEKTNTTPSITVTGHGETTIPTTLSQVTLGVEVTGKTAQQVQQEAARRSSSVVNLLRSHNVQKLKTTGISLHPEYSYKDNVQRLIGYTANNSLSFRINTEQAGSLLDQAVQAGATQINGISFVASDQALAQARVEALKKATQDAQQQANAVLSALGLQAKQVISIQVDAANPSPPTPVYDRAVLKAEAAPSTPVVGTDEKVEASVTLNISY